MNKTFKKTLIFIALLVVVVLIIVLVALLFPKRTTTGTNTPSPSASSASSPSPSVSASPSPTSSPSPTPSASGSPSPSASPADAGSVTTEKTADGTKYNVTVPGSYVSYSVTADSSLFTHTRDSGSELFKSAGNKSAYIKITFLPGAKAVTAAPSFLNSYIKYTNFEQSGKNYIDGTKLAGETVMADDGKTQVTAWLVDTERGVLAVVMSLDLTNQITEQPQLDKLLSTLKIAT